MKLLNPSMGDFLLMMLNQGIEESNREQAEYQKLSQAARGNKMSSLYSEAAMETKGRNWAYKNIKILVENFCLQEK